MTARVVERTHNQWQCNCRRTCLSKEIKQKILHQEQACVFAGDIIASPTGNYIRLPPGVLQVYLDINRIGVCVLDCKRCLARCFIGAGGKRTWQHLCGWDTEQHQPIALSAIFVFSINLMWEVQLFKIWTPAPAVHLTHVYQAGGPYAIRLKYW